MKIIKNQNIMVTRWIARNKSFFRFYSTYYGVANCHYERWKNSRTLINLSNRYKVLSIKKIKRIKNITWSILIDSFVKDSYHDNDLYIVTVESDDPRINSAPIVYLKNQKGYYSNERCFRIG